MKSKIKNRYPMNRLKTFASSTTSAHPATAGRRQLRSRARQSVVVMGRFPGFNMLLFQFVQPSLPSPFESKFLNRLVRAGTLRPFGLPMNSSKVIAPPLFRSRFLKN